MSVFSALESRACYVYALLCVDDDTDIGYVKFGHTRRLDQRLTEIRTSCPVPARYFAFVRLPSEIIMRDVEKSLHQKFKDRRSSREWFRFDFSSKHDKSEFNDGSKEVFKSLLRHDVWWDKVDVETIDRLNAARKADFMRLSKDAKRKAMNRVFWKRKAMKDQSEMAEYRNPK